MAKVSSNQKVDIAEINRPPKYLDSPSDIPYQVRLGSGIDIAENLFRIQGRIPFEISFTSGPGGVSSSTTLTHALGYRPFIQGYYVVLSSDNSNFAVGQRGLIPEYRQYGVEFFGTVPHWTVWVDEINNLSLQLNVSGLDVGAFTGSIKGTLLLFKEISV
jgi:hypothetical protein